MAGTTHSFHFGDYVVFAITTIISLGIGVFYAFSGGRQKTTSEYLVGGRSMNFLPVAISLLVSFESSIMMLGLPAEAYIYGVEYMLSTLGFLISLTMGVILVVPLFHPLKITSAYEYLELRFQSRTLRLMGTILGMLSYVWYMGVVLFGPAVALEAVTDFPLWASIFFISIVSIVYTAIGGLKAVIWTDVFQSVIMFGGIFAILIKGTLDVGSAKKVWDIAKEGGRFNLFDFDPDPTVRHTFWNLLVGTTLRGFGTLFNQSTVQRVSSCKDIKQARWVMLFVGPTFFFTMTVALYEGVVAYAYYFTKRCDPIESKQITDPNQIMPLMVMDIFKDTPGMPGLFLASLFSASLSTLSSGLSSLSALLWADIVKPVVGEISEFKATVIAKVSVVVFGLIACVIAILVAEIGGPMNQIGAVLTSSAGGPLTGIFFLACFCPRVTAKGAIFGSFFGASLSIWIAMGMSFSKNIKRAPYLPAAPTDQCMLDDMFMENSTEVMQSMVNGSYSILSTIATTNLSSTSTIDFNSTTAAPESGPQGIEKLYTISYMWLATVGIISTMVFAYIFSFITGMNKPGDVDPRYLIPLSDMIFCCPRVVRDKLRGLGPSFTDPKYKDNFLDPARFAAAKDMELTVDPATAKDPLCCVVNDNENNSNEDDDKKKLKDSSCDVSDDDEQVEFKGLMKDSEKRTNGHLPGPNHWTNA